MNFTLTVLTVLVLTTVLYIAGCTSNLPYRTSFAPFDPTHPDKKAVIETNADYTLGFVEFDDQGWFWDPNQRVAVEQMIRDQAGIGDPTHATPQGIVLVAFVHGWKDNADYDNDGVTAFRAILEELHNLEQSAQTRGHRSARKIVGVYAGWRGLSATWEPFKELSFWERKDTAHKVGGYGAMTKLLVDLESIQKDSLDALPKNAPRTELIIIGHSFGGAAVYSALSQIITERFIDTIGNTKKPTRLKPLGDQVILLNPAFEAQRHSDLNLLAQEIQKYPQDQRPVLSIFTSESDWATRYTFPIGRFFATIFQSNRDHNQKVAGLETIGWFGPFITHQLIYSAANPAAVEPLHSFDIVQGERAKWVPNSLTRQTYYLPNATLKPCDTYKPGNPFWIVSVDPQIMNGHSDIANPHLIKFLRDYIEFTRVDPHDHSK